MIKITEAELAQIVLQDMCNLGYEIYKEVSISTGGSRRCDIYAIHESGATVVIETKLSFGLKVIEQAYNWMPNANTCFVAIPKGKRRVNSFGQIVCKFLGVGVIEVDVANNSTNIVVSAKPNINIKMPKLYEKQKLSIAGNANSDYVTPFGNTRDNIYVYMEGKDDIDLLTVVRNIKHHYASDYSAVGSLKKLFDGKVIKGLCLVRNCNRLQVHHITEKEDTYLGV